MKIPLVSIIIPIYNTERFLSECINSILIQSYDNFELILVNDGSSDNSLQICKQYSEKDKRIKILNQSNQGATAARKNGVWIAQGKYILFVDSDDTLPFNSIEILVSAIKDDIDIVIGSLNNNYNRNELIDANTYRIKCIKGNIFPGPVGKLFKKNLFKDYVFDIPKEIIKGEDMLMNVRIAFNCKNNILLLPYVVYEYRLHDESCISKFRTSWSYEGQFYEQLFASVPSNKYEEYITHLISKAMDVWNDFYGYRCRLPQDYRNTKLYRLLSENIERYKVDINLIDKALLIRTNYFYRFIIINIKRFIRIINFSL